MSKAGIDPDIKAAWDAAPNKAEKIRVMGKLTSAAIDGTDPWDKRVAAAWDTLYEAAAKEYDEAATQLPSGSALAVWRMCKAMVRED